MNYKLDVLTLYEILERYALPHRLLAYFASQCAKDAVSKLKASDRDPRSLAAISMAEAFGNGEDFTPEHMKEVIDAAHAATSAANAASYAATSAAYAATYAAAYAAYAANAASDAAHAATSAASYAANSATYDKALDSYKTFLLTLIETRLTKLEQILIIG